MEVQWPLVIFTLFIAMGSGILCVLGILALMGKDEKIRFPALVCSLVAIVIGGVASLLHLQHFGRIFNGFGHITSGITQELIGIVLIVIVLVIFFIFAVRGKTPKWVGVLAIVFSVVMVILMTHSYSMESRPTWDNFFVYLFYLGDAFLLGASGTLILQGIRDDDGRFVSILTIIGGAVQTVAVLCYGIYAAAIGGAYSHLGLYFDSSVPTQGLFDPQTTLSSALAGSNSLLFWGGALVVGSIVPLVAGIIGMKQKKTALTTVGIIAFACTILGGIAFRVVLYNMGIAFYSYF